MPKDGAEQVEFLAHREAMEGLQEHLLLIEVEKLNCHIHMPQSIDYIRRHHPSTLQVTPSLCPRSLSGGGL